MLDLSVTLMGDVVRDSFAERGIDGSYFGRDFIEIEIEIVRMDKIETFSFIRIPKASSLSDLTRAARLDSW